MSKRLIFRRVLPFFGMCVVFAGATVAVDAALHAVDLRWVGRYLGIPGVCLIVLSLTYSLRKRGKISWGKPRALLHFHEWAAWIGASLVLVHAGVHFEALLPWVATAAMGINVLSGLVGKFLLTQAREAISARRQALASAGFAPNEIEDRLLGDLTTMRAMSRWRTIHIPIFLTFVVTSFGHIVSILLFWNWR